MNKNLRSLANTLIVNKKSQRIRHLYVVVANRAEVRYDCSANMNDHLTSVGQEITGNMKRNSQETLDKS